MKCASGAHVDQSSNFVAVTRLILKQRQNQQFRTSFFPLVLHSGRHICRSHISIRRRNARNFISKHSFAEKSPTKQGPHRAGVAPGNV